MSKPQERKEGLRVTRPSSLSSRAKTPVLSVKSFTLTAGRGCVEVKSPWVPQLRTHTHTHTNSIDVLGFRLLFIFYTHFLHSQTQTVQPSMWFFKGSCACWTTPFKMYRNANIWLSSGIKDLLDTRPLFITLSLHNHCAQGTISAVLFGYMAGLMKMFANKSFDKVVKILYWMSSAWETDQWVKCIVWCFCT